MVSESGGATGHVSSQNFEVTIRYRKNVVGPDGDHSGTWGTHLVILTLKGYLARPEGSDEFSVPTLKSINTFEEFKAPNGGNGVSSSAGG